MKHLIDVFAFLCARVAILILEHAPDRFAYGYARLLIRVLRIAMPRLDRIARRNLSLAFPAMEVEERERILKQSYRVLASNLVTFARGDAIASNPELTIAGEAAFLTCMKEARAETSGGVLIATMHFGCFELALQLIASRYQPIAALIRPFGLRRLDALWTRYRERCGSRIFGRKGGYKELVRRLQAGEDVAILCDQNVKKNHAVFVDFFGRQTSATKTTSLASLQTGCPVVLATFYRDHTGQYHVFSKRLKRPDPEEFSREEWITGFAQILHAEIEGVVRAHPEQWFWIHRRWKTRPAGEAETLYDSL